MSLSCSVSDRLARLREMRDSLCKKEKKRDASFTDSEWIIDQLQLLQSMTENEETSKCDIKERISDILCVLSPAGESDE